MKNLKTLSVFVLSFSLIANIFLASSARLASAATCIFLSTSLRYQSSDSTTSGQVSVLQNFLSSSGYLSSTATGYFGNLTLAAVKSFQSANGLPATGFVGPLTKDKIANISCGNIAGGNTTGGGGIIQTNTVCGPGALFNTITGAPCSGTQIINGCPPGAYFNTITGASCSNIARPSINLSSSLFYLSDNSTRIDYNFYDPNNSPGYDVYVYCPSNVTVNYQGSNACGSFRLYSGARSFSLSAYNNSGSSQSLTVRVSPVSSISLEDTETVYLPARNNSINVTNPTSGQSYAIGESMNIRWNAPSNTSSVVIELVKGSSVYGAISYSAQNTGSFTWTIPSIAPVGSDNKIRISDAYNTSNYDESDGLFNITQSTYSSKSINTFNLTTPSATGAINETNKTIVLTVPYGTNVTSLAPVITTSGNSTVSPLSGVPQNFTTYKDYVVKAQDGSTQSYRVTVAFATASAEKAILGFNIASPAATGSVNESAKTVTISYPVNTVVTSLIPTITVSPNATVSPLSGVPQNFSSPKTYIVKAQDGTLQPYVVSVSVAQPFLTLTAPNGGNSIQRGTTMHIAWDHLGISNVKVELLNGATKVADIATKPASDGSVDYSLPISLALGSNYKVRITDTANAARTDTSDAVFSVVENTSPLSFSFTNPSQGSNNYIGMPLTMSWTTTGYVPNVGIAVVNDTGTTSLTAFTPNTGSYTWNVPADQPTGSDYSLFVYNTTNGSIFAYSPKFNFVRGRLTVTSPTPGAEYFSGKNLPITWTTDGYVPQIAIKLIVNGVLGAGALPPIVLPAPTANTGSYIYPIPSTKDTRTDYRIQVYSTTDSKIFATTSDFKITQPRIMVTAPAGGAAVTRGTTMNVSWTATNNISFVAIDLMKGATKVLGLSPSTPANAGSVGFFLPTTLAAGSDYYVRITDMASTLTDKNDLPFTLN